VSFHNSTKQLLQRKREEEKKDHCDCSCMQIDGGGDLFRGGWDEDEDEDEDDKE
jgi:hypothetical protein